MGRLYGDKVEIERDAVKNFFNKRASKDGDSNNYENEKKTLGKTRTA